jgi:predicted O-methyltransferase YrrM
MLLRVSRAQRVLEVGTLNGYTAICLGGAVADVDGTVTVIESDTERAATVRANVDRAGLEGYVDILHQDAGIALAGFDDDYWDVVVLSAHDDDRACLLPDVRRSLRAGGLLVAGNVAQAESLAAGIVLDPAFTTVLIPSGAGHVVAYKH